MMHQLKNNYGWGILIFLLWGFFFLLARSGPFSGTWLHFLFALTYAMTISLILFLSQRWIFPRLYAFPPKVQLPLKAFFYAGGALTGYLIVFLGQLLLYLPQEDLVYQISSGFVNSLKILLSAPLSAGNLVKMIPQNVISAFTTFSVLLVMIALISIVLSYVDTRWKQMKSERQLQDARLKILEMQMQPHFLFNALNTIVSTIRIKPARAEALLIHLSDFLRYNFNLAGRELAPLQEEIDFVENYLQLMNERFDTRLQWQIEVDPACRLQPIPVMILQPIVENAVKYSIGTTTDVVSLSIHCFRARRACILKISDQGPGLDLKSFSPFPIPGHSLDIIRQRLQLQYTRAGLMDIASQPGKGLTVTIKIPDRSGHGETDSRPVSKTHPV